MGGFCRLVCGHCGYLFDFWIGMDTASYNVLKEKIRGKRATKRKSASKRPQNKPQRAKKCVEHADGCQVTFMPRTSMQKTCFNVKCVVSYNRKIIDKKEAK